MEAEPTKDPEPVNLTEDSAITPYEDIFISYSRRDAERVGEFEAQLHSWGYSVWRDTEDMAVASSWSKQIVTAIKGCNVFLLVASATSFQSDNVRREIRLAFDSKKIIMPVYLEPLELPDEIAYELSGIQHVELFGENQAHSLKSIRKVLKLHCTRKKLRDQYESKPLAPSGKTVLTPRDFLGKKTLISASVLAAVAVGFQFSRSVDAGSGGPKMIVEIPEGLASDYMVLIRCLDDEKIVRRIDFPGPAVFGPIVSGGSPGPGRNMRDGPDVPIRLGDRGEFQLQLFRHGDDPEDERVRPRYVYPDPSIGALSPSMLEHIVRIDPGDWVAVQ